MALRGIQTNGPKDRENKDNVLDVKEITGTNSMSWEKKEEVCSRNSSMTQGIYKKKKTVKDD